MYAVVGFTRIFWVCLAWILLPGMEAVEEPLVLWTQRSHIWSKMRGIIGDPSSWLNRTVPSRAVQSVAITTGFRYALGYDPKNDAMFWSDVNEKSIYKQPIGECLGETPPTQLPPPLLDTGKASDVTGIAVDWLAGNVYFSDRGNKRIGVVPTSTRLTGIVRYLFTMHLTEPRGITLDPYEGLLIWADAGRPRIEVSSLAGTGRRDLVVNALQEPIGVTVDVKTRTVFWVDRKKGTIESIAYDGSQRRTLSDNGEKYTFHGIAVTQDYIISTTESSLKRNLYNRTSGELLRAFDIDASIYDIILIPKFTDDPTHSCNDMECKHICINTGNREGACTCKEGFYLQLDGISCTESKPRYIYSVGKTLFSADVNIDNKQPRLTSERIVASGMNRVQALGFHYESKLLYFSDTERDVIYRDDPDVGRWQEHTVNTRLVEGIAVDWLTSNVYWSDADLGHIMLSRLDGSYHTVLLEGIGRPKGIAVDPVARQLFWTDAASAGVYQAELDGTNAKVLLTKGIEAPQGIVVDPRVKRLYWTDTTLQQIERANLDGGSRSTMLSLADTNNLYDVTIFQEYATWTNGDRGLQFGLESTGEILPRTDTRNNSAFQQSYDVVSYGVYLQPHAPNDCANNADCHQLCYQTLPAGHRCGCAIGYQLNTDGRSCLSDITDEFFVLYVDPYHKQIYQLKMTPKQPTQGVHVPKLTYPTSVDFDPATGRVYWLDSAANVIKGSTLKGSDEKVLLHVSDAMKIERIAIDPLSQFLFYTDSKERAIFKLPLSAEGGRQLVVSNLDRPYAVAVDYNSERLYWSTLSPNAKISMSKLDGSDRRDIVTGISQPTGLTVNPDDHLLYYSDERTGRIVELNVTSGASFVMMNESSRDVHAIACSQNYIYFTAWSEKGIYRISRTSGTGLTLVSERIFARLTDIKVFERRLPSPLVGGGGGTNILVIVAAALAAILFLLFLLLAWFCARRCRKNRKPASTEATPVVGSGSGVGGGGGGETAEVEGDYLNFINYSMFARDGATTGDTGTEVADVPPPVPQRAAPDAYGNCHSMPRPSSNGVSDGSANGVAKQHLNGLANGHGSGNGNGMSATPDLYASTIPSTSPPPVVTVAAPPPVKRRYQRNPAKPSTRRSGFEMPDNGKVATVIQRVVARLRGGIGSIRWSGGSSDGDGRRNSGGSGGSMPPADVTVDGTEAGSIPAIGPERGKPTPRGRIGYIPPSLHPPPRGWAPASHSVPKNVKTTWGRAKIAANKTK